MARVVALLAVLLAGCGGSMANDQSSPSDGGTDAQSADARLDSTDDAVTTIPVDGKALRLAANDTHLFWLSSKDGGILMRMALTGGPSEYFGNSGDDALAVHGTRVYSAADATDFAPGGILGKSAVDASDLGTLYGELHGGASAYLAFSDTDLFWVNTIKGRSEIDTSSIGSTISAYRKIIEDLPEITGLAFAPRHYLYFSSAVKGGILEAEDFGSTTTVLASGQANPSDVTYADGQLYWINHGDTTTHSGGALMSMTVAKATAGPPSTLSTTDGEPTTSYMSGDIIYFGTWNGSVGSIRSYASGVVRTLATGLDQPISLVVAGGSAFMSDVKGNIVRVAL